MIQVPFDITSFLLSADRPQWLRDRADELLQQAARAVLDHRYEAALQYLDQVAAYLDAAAEVCRGPGRRRGLGGRWSLPWRLLTGQ